MYDLYAAGCRDIVRETFDSSVRMGRSAYAASGMSEEDVDQASTGFIDDDRTAMIIMAELYDPQLATTDNVAYVNKVKEISAIHDALTSEGIDGLGMLSQKLAESGEDPADILKRLQDEANAS